MAHILIVDDDIHVIQLMRTMLEVHDHIVVSATDGEEGERLCGENEFDLVIADMILPVKGGIKMISDLIRIYPGIKIIAISGGGAIDSKNYLTLAEELGAKLTLKKPFSAQELIAAVNQVLQQPTP